MTPTSSAHRMLPLLLGSPIQAYARTFWWKAQAVTYVVRPNRRTRQELDTLRQKVLVNVPASLATAVSVRRSTGYDTRTASAAEFMYGGVVCQGHTLTTLACAAPCASSRVAPQGWVLVWYHHASCMCRLCICEETRRSSSTLHSMLRCLRMARRSRITCALLAGRRCTCGTATSG
jgi:hypothetical protein